MRPQDFWQLYRAVYRRRWLVAAVVCGTLAVVGTACLLMPRYYRASAFVMPSQYALSKPVIPGTAASLTPPSAAPRQSDTRREREQLATLIGLAKTGEVRKRAIESLGLAMTPSQLEELVTAEPGEGSIIRVSALASSGEGAVSLANALAHQFAEYYQDLAGYQARQNLKFLEGALTDAEAKLETARENLQALKGEQGEAALPVGSAENPFLTQFYSLRAEIDETSSRLREVEGRLGAIRNELAQQTPTKQVETRTTDNPVTRAMLDDLARLERDLLVAQTRYTDKHRKVIELKAQIADLKARIEREGGTMVTQRTVTVNPVYERLREQIVELRTEKEALNAKLASLSRSMTENERRAGRLADSSVALVAKSVEHDNAQARYNQVKELLDAARLEERLSSRSGELQVVDEAKSAAGPVTKGGPSMVQLLVLGIALSLFLGIGTAVTLAFLDTRIFERGDLQRGLELPVATVVPALIGGTPTGSLARITELQPQSAHAEAYRYLRAQLLYRNGQAPMRTLLIATARPGQGGSTTAVNLALALAEVDERVVLVDADLRRPSLHRFFGQDNEAGLTTVLSNGGDASRALRPTSVANMLLLPAGPPTPNPAALLTSGRMRQLLAQLRAHCDYVVIDTPSAGAFADAIMLAPLTDGVILVSRANQSLRETEQHTKELLRTVGANVIGAVLNDAPTERVDSYRFHTHYYGHMPALPAPDNGHSTVTVIAPEESPRAGTRPRIPQVRRRRRTGLVVMAVVALCAAVGGLSYHFGLGGAVRRHVRAAPAERPAAAPAVTVRAVVAEPTAVRVERDGELLYEGPLTAGQQIWQGAKEITVWAERPEALELTVNGRSIGRLGQPGDQPTSRRFTAEQAEP